MKKRKIWGEYKNGENLGKDKITQIHPVHIIESYKLIYRRLFDMKVMVLSKDHLLYCNIKKLPKKIKKQIKKNYKNKKIPKEILVHSYDCKESQNNEIFKYYTDGGNRPDCEFYEEIVEEDNKMVTDEDIWLTVEEILHLRTFGKIYLHTEWKNNKENKKKEKYYKVVDVLYAGKRECRCVSTDSGHYKINDIIHHNSVSVRGIINHTLTHNCALALVDIKQTEFTHYKNMKNVVGVANSIREAAEILRIARQVMYKRNKIMAQYELTDFADYKPKDPTNMIYISGREFNENDILQVKINGEVKQMKAGEIAELVK